MTYERFGASLGQIERSWGKSWGKLWGKNAGSKPAFLWACLPPAILKKALTPASDRAPQLSDRSPPFQIAFQGGASRRRSSASTALRSDVSKNHNDTVLPLPAASAIRVLIRQFVSRPPLKQFRGDIRS